MIAATSHPVSSFNGYIRVPGDKSISHRAIMLGGLADGETLISGLLEGEDVMHTALAMRALGARIVKGDDGLWRCEGIGKHTFQTPTSDLDMGNSGTSARLMMGVLAGHAITARMIGDASLSKRPMNRVITPLTHMGAKFEPSEGGRLPLTLHGIDKLQAISYELPIASAQVKSAILLAGLRADGETTIIENTPTRDHTENMLQAFGVELKRGAQEISIKGGQVLEACAIDIPADPSSAAFPMVASLLTSHSKITLTRVGLNPRRAGLFETLKEMNANLTYKSVQSVNGELIGEIEVMGGNMLRGVDVPKERIASMIDEIPILCVAASFADGVTRIHNIGELRVKESDRLSMMAQGLSACGVKIETGEDWIHIHGLGKKPQGGAHIATAFDHRIAMSFLVMGSACETSVTVDDITPIRTSFPNFIDVMNDAGAHMT